MLLDKKIPLSYIARKVRRDAITVLIIAVAVEVLLTINRTYVPVIPAAIPAFLGTAISLILSFKLSQSYDRWWEARKIWGAIVNDSRTLVRQLLSFVDTEVDTRPATVVHKMAHRQIAWCYCLGQSLRNLDWRVGTAGHLSPEEIDEAESFGNKPVALMQHHAGDLAQLARDGHVTDYQRIAIDDTFTRLTDSMGKAERIRNTVFPRTYGLFLHSSIYLFISLLSVALAEVDGAWQVAVTTVIAIPFFLLERTAVHMQDPFANRPTDTAVTSIARSIEINILQLLREPEVPKPLAAEGFYLM